jgi:tyrosyl-DNA phosphodiesterase-1
MTPPEAADRPPSKRRKLNLPNEEVATTEHQSSVHKGIDKPISPPSSRRKSPEPNESVRAPTWSFHNIPKQTLAARPSPTSKAEEQPTSERDSNSAPAPQIIASPVQLTRIADLAAHQNVDAVGLGDLLGDPLIKECWNFNFLFDLDFVMYETSR